MGSVAAIGKSFAFLARVFAHLIHTHSRSIGGQFSQSSQPTTGTRYRIQTFDEDVGKIKKEPVTVHEIFEAAIIFVDGVLPPKGPRKACPELSMKAL